MIKQEMEDTLKKDSLFVRYYITELSLKQLDGKLLDYDSNYFRHILSNENYIKLPFPYYQPPLDTTGIMQSFNLAIHANVSENTDVPYIYKEKYLDIVTELYYAHYLEWYKNYYEYDSYKKIIDSILKKIKREIADNCKTEIISLVQCKLYDEGQCPKMSFENISLPKLRKKKVKQITTISVWILFCILTFVFCLNPKFSNHIKTLCSFFTIFAGGVSVFVARKDLFSSQ